MKIEPMKNGTVRIEYALRDKRVKIRVSKDGGQYDYNHQKDITVIPLQMGSGRYRIEVYRQTRGDSYKSVHSETITHNCDGISVFLNPNAIVEYSDDSACVRKARSLAGGINAQTEKVKTISGHIMDRLAYDRAKASKAKNGELGEYEPDADIIYNAGRGMCYDYAALFAVMLRSLSVPCKLVFGHIGNGAYHAWNEVLLGGKWERYDLTFEDAGVKGYDDYTAKKWY